MRRLTIPLHDDDEAPRAPSGETTPSTRLAGDVATSLVSLRSLLEEASLRVADSTEAGRRVAAILLDGCSEAAIALGLASFSGSPKDRDTLETLHQRLLEHLRGVDSLGVSEGLIGWSGVRQLRKARNLAQHHQVPPDHASLRGWAPPVADFCSHVVRLVHGADLKAVTLAAAIVDPTVREPFERAEMLNVATDPRSVVEALGEAFATALRLWRDQRRIAGLQQPGPGHDDLGLGKFVEGQTAHLDELLEVAPFAVDLGEYFWWRQLRTELRDHRVQVSSEDAVRARAWVFGWITRWESFASRRTTRERLDFDRRAPLSRRAHGAPEVDPQREVVVEPDSVAVGGAVIRVPLRWGDGSPEDWMWSSALERVTLPALRAGAERIRASLDRDGWLVLYTDSPAVLAVDIQAALVQIIARADADREKILSATSEAEERASRGRAAALEVAEAIGHLRHADGSHAYDKIEIEIGDGDADDKLTAVYGSSLKDEVWHSVFARRGVPGWEVPDLSGGRMNGIGVAVDLEDRALLVDAAAEAIAIVSEAATQRSARKAEREQSLRSLRDDLTPLLRGT